MSDIEEQFFKTFEIESKRNCYWSNIHCKDCNEDCVNFYIKPEYPKITDRILLQLIVIVTNYVNDICEMMDVEDLKKSTLEELIEISDNKNIKHQVKALFGSEEER